MKIGDQKQAVTLGVVAVLAIGFLAKTIFSSFSGKMTNKPMEVVELRGGRKPEEKASEAAKSPTTAPTPPETAQKTAEEPKAPDIDFKQHLDVRDAFASFSMQSKNANKGFTNPKANMGQISQESSVSTPPLKGLGPAKVFDDQGEISGSVTGTEAKGIGKIDRNGEQGTTPEVKKESVTLRFDGYVNAGSPMAVLTYKGTTITVGVGDTLPDGSRVEKISSEKVTLKKGKITTTVLVGRESEI